MVEELEVQEMVVLEAQEQLTLVVAVAVVVQETQVREELVVQVDLV